MFKIILALFCLFGAAAAASQDVKNCQNCHTVEKFDAKNHDFECANCHVSKRTGADFSHDDIVRDPASAQNMDEFCGDCHAREIKKFKNSNHFTHANEINLVFKTFGLDRNFTLQNLPAAPAKIQNKEDLVTDMLRRKCLRCHTENAANYDSGTHHGKGCMACHAGYRSDGKYRGSDKIMRNKTPFAARHELRKPSANTCLACHNKIFVGGDFAGLFPKDFDKSYRAPLDANGKFPPQIFGADYHRLSPDVHFSAGMSCADCHKGGEQKLSCENCHEKSLGGLNSNLNYSNLKSAAPVFAPKSANFAYAHAPYHSNLNCVSCHASWQTSAYELSLLRDDTPNYAQWANLIDQEDGYLRSFLRSALATPATPPKMPDYVSGELKDGVWYSGFRFRRWENLLLGNDENGKVAILRPFFQYRISYKNAEGEMVFDDVSGENGQKFEAFVPFSPHTISKKAKSCEACHENALQMADFRGKGAMELLKGKVLKGTPLAPAQLKKLNSQKYRQIRAKMLFENEN